MVWHADGMVKAGWWHTFASCPPAAANPPPSTPAGTAANGGTNGQFGDAGGDDDLYN